MSTDTVDGAARAARSLAGAVRLHGVCDLLFAAFYAWVGFSLAPSRTPWFSPLLGVVIVLLAVAGVGLLARIRLARALALVAHSVLLAFTAVMLVLLVASAAYLRGIYGPLGQGMAAITLAVAALLIEACGLLPLLQLRFLLRDDVRALFGPASRTARPAAARAR